MVVEKTLRARTFKAIAVRTNVIDVAAFFRRIGVLTTCLVRTVDRQFLGDASGCRRFDFPGCRQSSLAGASEDVLKRLAAFRVDVKIHMTRAIES